MGVPANLPAVIFYGHVQDQDGQPIGGAEVVVRTTELVPNDWTPGSVVPDNVNAKTISVYTGRQGDFALTMPQNHNVLIIEALKRPGYEWVKDWAWQLPSDERNNNGYYVFPGRHWQCPVYRPDPNNPAIFPLHLQGSAKPVGKTSRGGSDLGKNGVVTVNQAVAPKIPSTGPGAPRTPKEIEDAITAFLDKFNRAKP